MDAKGVFKGADSIFVISGVKPQHHTLQKKLLLKCLQDRLQQDRIPKRSTLGKISDNVCDYLENSSLHGLRYVGDKSLSNGERLFWLVAFLLAGAASGYYIRNIYDNYYENPVIMTMNAKSTHVQDIPFPSVTICNMNSVKKSEADVILESGTPAEKSFLDDVCDSENAAISSKAVDEETGKWENVIKFMKRVTPTCEEMLKMCQWRNKDVDCAEIFRTIVTDEGMCCNFNQLPLDHILRSTTSLTLNQNVLKKYHVDNWNAESGYSHKGNFDIFPFRSPGPGPQFGLTIMLDTRTDDYYCSTTSSIGFKISLNSPSDIPKMSDFGFMIPPGNEMGIVFQPTIMDATEGLRYMDVAKRHCYFQDERRLMYYRIYTKMNCKMECLANLTQERCGCVPYYLPKNDSTKVCGKMQEACSDSIKGMMELEQMSSIDENECSCLPACFQLDFEKTISYGQFSDAFKMRYKLLDNTTIEYFRENMILMHIYFVNVEFTKFTKSELYGFSEFLSNTGGLLGLFLGFSCLSIVEVLYHLTFKWICGFIRSKRKKHVKDTVILVK